MDEGRNRSIVLFVLMGLFFIFAIIYAFVIAPRTNASSLEDDELLLELPIQKWQIRYADFGIKPFCSDGNKYITIEVEENTTIFSSSDGVVKEIDNGIVLISVSNNVFLEYSPVFRNSVFVGDYVTKGSSIGRVKGSTLNLGIKNTRDNRYECPYRFFNDFGKGILDDIDNVLGYDVDLCECDNLSY